MNRPGLAHAGGIAPATDQLIIEKFFSDYDVVARAPACVFLFGNHSVVYGHVGLYLPLPRYTYVGLKEDPSIVGLGLAESHPLNWIDATASLESCNEHDFAHKVKSYSSLDEQNQHYLLSACEVIRERYFAPEKMKTGLRMRVFCQQPPMSGMNSSGSIAAALVMALSTYFEQPVSADELARARRPLEADALAHGSMRGSPAFEDLSTLAWFLDDCLHGLGGTAIGSVGALMGSENGLPFMFLTEARTGLSADALESADDYRRAESAGLADRGGRPWQGLPKEAGIHPFNYKHLADLPGQRLDAMARLTRMVIRLDDTVGAGQSLVPRWWNESGIGLVYGGDPKFTRHMLERMGGRLEAMAGSTFVTSVLDLALAHQMQLNPLESWLLRTSAAPGDLDLHEWHEQLVGPCPDYKDEWFRLQWRKQQRKELMMLLMGGTSYLALNALGTRDPYTFASLLSQQQALFKVLGMSRPSIDVLCAHYDEYLNQDDRRPFGTTITGGGGGGDVVVFGDNEALEQQFDLIFAKADSEIEQLNIARHEGGQVHYRSWTESRVAEPTRLVFRKTASAPGSR
jgi:mevalonate kinase